MVKQNGQLFFDRVGLVAHKIFFIFPFRVQITRAEDVRKRWAEQVSECIWVPITVKTPNFETVGVEHPIFQL